MNELMKESKEFKILFDKSANLLSGKYSSKIKGDGLEFVDLKEYIPGDDIRRIDWKVTARKGEVFVKEFLEDKDASHFILIDTSKSMENKLNSVKILATSLLISSNKNSNSFTVGFFNSNKSKLNELSKSKNQLMKYIYEILNIKTKGESGIEEILILILNLVSKRIIVSIITDELTLSEKAKSLLFAINKKHKLNYFQVYSSEEKNLELGINSYEDIETGIEGIYDLSEEEIIEYINEYDKQLKLTENTLISLKIKPILIDTDMDLKTQIIKIGGEI